MKKSWKGSALLKEMKKSKDFILKQIKKKKSSYTKLITWGILPENIASTVSNINTEPIASYSIYKPFPKVEENKSQTHLVCGIWRKDKSIAAIYMLLVRATLDW